MIENTDFQSWNEAQEHPIPLDSTCKIIDFLNPDKKMPNTPEVHIRQHMALERSVQISKEKKRTDIVLYTNSRARADNDQSKIAIIGDTKAPTEKEPDGQLHSYISATSALGGFWTNGNIAYFYKITPDRTEIFDWPGIPKDCKKIEEIGRTVLESIEGLKESIEKVNVATELNDSLLSVALPA